MKWVAMGIALVIATLGCSSPAAPVPMGPPGTTTTTTTTETETKTTTSTTTTAPAPVTAPATPPAPPPKVVTAPPPPPVEQCPKVPNPKGCPETEPNVNGSCAKKGLECNYSGGCCPSPVYYCKKGTGRDRKQLRFEARFYVCE